MSFASILRQWCKMIQLLLNKTTPHFQLLPMSTDLPKALKRDSIYNIDVLF